MDSSEKPQRDGNPSPRLASSYFSNLFFWWLKPLFYQGKARDLKNDDLYDALPTDVSEKLGGRLEKYWKDEVENARQSDRKPKLVNAIRKSFGWSYFYYAGHMLVLSCLRLLQPFTLGIFIQHFERNAPDTTSRSAAYGLACALVILTFAHSLLKHHIDMGTLEIGMRLRIACSSLVYRKMLRLSNASVGASTGGQIINLLSNDVARFDPLFMYLHYVWITPIQAALTAYLIWRNVQLVSLAGVLLMVVMTIPVQTYIGKMTTGLRGDIATRTDERVRLMGEIVNGIHVIKMYTWEKPFERLVSLARRYEIDVITKLSYLKALNISSNAFTDRTCLYFTLMAYALAGNPITADKVFSMVQYFTILQILLIYNYPRAIFNAAEARTSVKRIEKFLTLDEIKIKAPLLSIEDNGSITLKSVMASWSANLICNTLHNVSMQIAPRKLHAIIGPVGSGKTSLIQLILGELRSTSGDVKINGTISYASQCPWLFPGSLRENVLFDQTYDEQRYNEVIKVCALERDIARLPHGDRTNVGERGSSLSGGQCARVNLARAVYKDADVYIFDDPFSAVDPSVCKSLFNDCLVEYLRDKTRVFVTHQVQCLKEADTIFLLSNGKLDYQGRFEDLPKKEITFLHLSVEEESEEAANETISNGHIPKQNANDVDSVLAKPAKSEGDEEPIETEELIAKGKMKNSVFTKYLRTGNSYLLLVAALLFFVVAQSVRCVSDYWLAYWTNQEELRMNAPKLGTSLNLTTTTMTTTSIPSTTQSTTTLSTTKAVLLPNVTLSTEPTTIIAAITESSLYTTTLGILSSTLETIVPSVAANSTESLMLETTTELPITTTIVDDTMLNSTMSALTSTLESLTSSESSSSVSSSTTESLLTSVTQSIATTAAILSPSINVSRTASSLLNSTTEKLFKLDVGNLVLDSTTSTSGDYSPTPSPQAEYMSVDLSLIIYGCILLCCVFFAISKCLLFYRICMNASRSIHDGMFSCVLRAPMRFFDGQSSGQILNRFSKDTGAMDEVLSFTVLESIEVFSVIVGVVVQVLIINWWSILPMIVTGFLCWKIRNFYVPTAYRIKRLEGAAKSPVLSYASASLDGLPTIRSSRAQTICCRRFDSRQDAHTRAHFLGIATASAFGLWLDLISVLLIAFVTFGCVIADETKIYAGSVGLAVTQVLMLCGMLQRGIRQTAEAITQMTSVERILQFTKLEQEEGSSASAIGTKPTSGWPSRGCIVFKEFSLRYGDEDEPVLRNVNVTMQPGAKIGIVGRTGAGKSSLISALFRLARSEGQILIDDVDTRKVSLADLRKRIAVIPQEPVLFSASLRDNLDPFHEFEDTKLWAALEGVELHKAFVPLDHPIECGGRNLSAGQRQLLCLARAIVKHTRILVLDEATANVDPATDALIRDTIRSKFEDCTVITVAHRLESVIDNDMIIVVENGEILEYDSPYELLRKKDGSFARMARLMGDSALEHLTRVAEETHTRLKEKVQPTTTEEERTNNANGAVKSSETIETAADELSTKEP